MLLQHTGGDPLLCSRAEKHALELRNQADTFRFITDFFRDDPERSPYTSSVLLELHRLTIQDIYPCSGEFRTALNQVEISGALIAPVHPSQVVNEMNDLLEAARRHSEGEHTLHDDMRFAAIAFHRFLAIHPFNGGNGRVARCFLMLMLYDLKSLSPPSQLFDYIERRRASYIPALQAADKGHPGILALYLTRGIMQCIFETLMAFLDERGMKDYVLRRLPRDQRRLCHPQYSASFSDKQFVREAKRLNGTIGKILSKIDVEDD